MGSGVPDHDGPVSGEAVGLTRDEIVREGEELAAIAPNLIVKVPTMPEGLAATRAPVTLGINLWEIMARRFRESCR